MHLSSPLTSSAAEYMSCPSWNVKSWTKIPEFYRHCLLTSVLALQRIRQYIIASHQLINEDSAKITINKNEIGAESIPIFMRCTCSQSLNTKFLHNYGQNDFIYSHMSSFSCNQTFKLMKCLVFLTGVWGRLLISHMYIMEYIYSQLKAQLQSELFHKIPTINYCLTVEGVMRESE